MVPHAQALTPCHDGWSRLSAGTFAGTGIRQGKTPFGALLRAHAVPQVSAPRAFFALTDPVVSAFFETHNPPAIVSAVTRQLPLSSQGQWHETLALAAPLDVAHVHTCYGRCNVISSPETGAVLAEVVEVVPGVGVAVHSTELGRPV
jgi:hypothetical protein